MAQAESHKLEAVQYFVVLLIAAALPLAADDFFETRIRPVLAKNCYACHSAQVQRPLGGIRLDSREAVAAANVIAPGLPEKSRLYLSLTYAHKVKMPPSGKLDDEVLKDFHSWISAGAPYPETAPAKSTAAFWAFQPVRSKGEWKIPVPTGAKPLDKAALLRRATFDLTGLPPSPSELRAFLEDASQDAYAKVVDRLLASPHYGERWARHWMDLVRYAETNGHEYDNDKLAPWRYRDYLIRAFNSDLPYDQLVREHIAGDLLPKQRLSADGQERESPLATGFYYFGEVLNSCTDPAKCRADEVDNQIDVLSKAFTGLTVACARCHDHKFDPIPTAEYYGLAGILHSTAYREIITDSAAKQSSLAKLITSAALLPSESETAYRAEDQVYATFDESLEKWRTEGVAFTQVSHNGVASSLAAGAPEFVGTLTSPAIEMSDRRYFHVLLSGNAGDAKTAGRANENSPVRLTLVCGGYKGRHIVPDSLGAKWVSLELILERNRRCYIEMIDHSRTGYLSVDEIAFSDLPTPPPHSGGLAAAGPLWSAAVPPSSFAVSAADAPEPRDVAVHVRGDHKQLGAIAARGFLKVLAKEQSPVTQGSGRLELAERIASAENPLTARVIVNRIWKHHFGEGLVKSTDNFGVMGERPKNQELLDELAGRLIADGWSLKKLHRALMLSELYQSNALKPRRLEAEALRDAILAVSGELDYTLYGPSITPHISAYQNGRGRPVSGPLDGHGRRSVYLQIRRNFIPPLFTAFDYPTPASTIGNRGASAVPSQALLLLNNEFVHDQSRKFAASALRSTPQATIRLMYERALARPPLLEELQVLLTYLEQNTERPGLDAYTAIAHVLFNSPEFLYVR
jgi:hypothetical protein